VDEAAIDEERVVEAIKGILVKDGVFAVTPTAVAASIGASPARVTAELDLDALVVEAYRALAVAEVAEVRRTILANPTPAVQMRTLLSWLAAPPEESDALRLEVWALSRRNPALRAVVREHEGAWHGVVSSVIRRGARDGDFPQTDADEIAALLISIVDGANNYEFIGYRAQTDRLRLLTRVVQAELGLTWGPDLEAALS
jgi:AcrR family transcriptional regulator